jgi:hypothetical protein
LGSAFFVCCRRFERVSDLLGGQPQEFLDAGIDRNPSGVDRSFALKDSPMLSGVQSDQSGGPIGPASEAI